VVMRNPHTGFLYLLLFFTIASRMNGGCTRYATIRDFFYGSYACPSPLVIVIDLVSSSLSLSFLISVICLKAPVLSHLVIALCAHCVCNIHCVRSNQYWALRAAMR
jgi:hypothetical protein